MLVECLVLDSDPDPTARGHRAAPLVEGEDAREGVTRDGITQLPRKRRHHGCLEGEGPSWHDTRGGGEEGGWWHGDGRRRRRRWGWWWRW